MWTMLYVSYIPVKASCSNSLLIDIFMCCILLLSPNIYSEEVANVLTAHNILVTYEYR